MTVVVKLGGSVARSDLFREWIGALDLSADPLAIVPGGGAFADTVRVAQHTMKFSDAAAHAMAILAMEQTGLVLLDLRPDWVGARTPRDFRAARRMRRTAVWLPTRMTTGAPDIPTSWNVTSDSLAAWLAGKLKADTLVLIKQTRDIHHTDTLETLVERGIVDPMLPVMLPSGVQLRVAAPDHVWTDTLELAYGRKLPGDEIARRPEFA